uniref:Uncharacterized protein n=1 Tax=Lotus japonicus TaxID=34305 RepID=I3SKH3_LOTJA|nr:unknown [Lotus japonicus]
MDVPKFSTTPISSPSPLTKPLAQDLSPRMNTCLARLTCRLSSFQETQLALSPHIIFHQRDQHGMRLTLNSWGI